MPPPYLVHNPLSKVRYGIGNLVLFAGEEEEIAFLCGKFLVLYGFISGGGMAAAAYQQRWLISGRRFSSQQRRKKGFQIGNPDTWLNLVPQLRIKFGKCFTTETVEHLVVKRTEEQATVLKSVCIGNFPAVSRDNIPQNIEAHGKPEAFTLNVIKLFGHPPNLNIGISEPLTTIVNVHIVMSVIREKVTQIGIEIFPIPTVTNKRYFIYKQKAVTVFILA